MRARHVLLLGCTLALTVLASDAAAQSGATPSATVSGPAPPSGAPGSSPDNPLTKVGRPTPPPQSVVVIKWPDGATEVVAKSEPPSDALLQRTVEERALAEGRKPVPPRPQAGPQQEPNTRSPAATKRRLIGASYGASACNGALFYPYKLTSTVVETFAFVTCTVDVTEVFGTIYLFRSANWTPIGVSTTYASGPGAGWETQGTCLSSTWQYNSAISWGFYGVNGGVFAPTSYAGPSWISC